MGKKGSGDRVCLGGMMVGERVVGREGIWIGDRMGWERACTSIALEFLDIWIS